MKEQKKLLLISKKIPPDYSGAGRRVLNYAHDLLSSGRYNSVGIVTSTNNPAVKNVNINIIHVKRSVFLQRYSVLSIINIFRIFFVLLPVVYKEKYKVVHIFGTGTNYAYSVILIAKILNIRIIFESTLFGSDDPVSISNEMFGSLKIRLLKQANSFVCISPRIYYSYIEKSFDKNYLSIIPNYCDDNVFCKTSNHMSKIKIKQALGLNNYKNIFLSVGRINARKRAFETIKAFQLINENLSNSALILVGPMDNSRIADIEYVNKIKHYINDYKLINVKLVGEREDIHLFYKIADIFLFSSTKEGLPNTIIEAISCGIPVIARMMPGIIDFIIEDKYNGFIVDSNIEMAKSAIHLIKNNNIYNRFSDNAKKLARIKFSKETILNSYMKLYNENN